MQSPLPNLRYEKKFLPEGFTLAEVLAGIRRHHAGFQEAYPPRTVNNLYLDSPTRRDYHDHVNGAADRTKTRVRWYGPKLERVEQPLLERKLKRGMISGKEAYALPQFPLSGASLASNLGAAFDAASLPPVIRLGLRHVEPALFNRYERRYFQSRDGKLRLTVDCGLQFARVRGGRGQMPQLSPSARTLIVELKFGLEVAENMDRVTNALPFRVARFSKYVAGLEGI